MFENLENFARSINYNYPAHCEDHFFEKSFSVQIQKENRDVRFTI
jgi:hypothetical protein